MTRQQITGLGPMNTVTNQMKIFTASKTPFIATPEWLKQQSIEPAVGDYLDTEGETTTLVSEASVSAAAAGAGPQLIDGRATKVPHEKKADGGQGSGSGSGLSPLPEYTAQQFVVTAGKITSIDGDLVTLENGAGLAIPGISKAGRIGVGDYWVSHEGEDGPGGFLPEAEFSKMFTLKE